MLQERAYDLVWYNAFMQLSAWVFLTDLLPEKKTTFDRFVIDKLTKQNIFQQNNIHNIFNSLKNSGVDGIEFLISSNATKSDIEKAQKILEQNTMPVLSIHQSLTTLFKITIVEVTRLFEIAQAFSAKIVVLHISAIGRQIFDKKYTLALQNLEKKYRITIALENNPKHILSLFKKFTWKGEDFSFIAIKNGFHMTFDTTHLAQTGGDILDFYKNNKTHIVNIHLSDYKKNFINKYLLLTKDTHLALGAGELPIKQFLKTLKTEKYKGLITMEINSTLEGLQNSARLIKSIVA